MERWSFAPTNVPSAATVKHTASTVVTADGRSDSASPQVEDRETCELSCTIPNAGYGLRRRTPLGCIHKRENGNASGIPAVHGLVANFALCIAPLRERQTRRRHLIFGPAVGTFEDDHGSTWSPNNGCRR